jgi:hypothetical protein
MGWISAHWNGALAMQSNLARHPFPFALDRRLLHRLLIQPQDQAGDL